MATYVGKAIFSEQKLHRCFTRSDFALWKKHDYMIKTMGIQEFKLQ